MKILEPTAFSKEHIKKFTLVELLVVVAIIGILLTILLPSLKSAKYAGYTAVCFSNLKSIATGFHLYAVDNNRSLPYDPSLTSWTVNFHHNQIPVVSRDLHEYLSGSKVYYKTGGNPAEALICPGFFDMEDKFTNRPFIAENGQPTNTNNNDKAVRSYNVNSWFVNIPEGHQWAQITGKKLPKLSEIRDTNSLIMVGETNIKNGLGKYRNFYYNPTHNHKGAAAKADGSAKLHAYRPNASGVLWSPNHGVSDSETVDTLGTYLHPGYSNSY